MSKYVYLNNNIRGTKDFNERQQQKKEQKICVLKWNDHFENENLKWNGIKVDGERVFRRFWYACVYEFDFCDSHSARRNTAIAMH